MDDLDRLEVEFSTVRVKRNAQQAHIQDFVPEPVVTGIKYKTLVIHTIMIYCK